MPNCCLPPQTKWDLGPKSKKICSRAWFNKIRKRHQKLANADDCYWYGVFDKKSGELLGHIDFDIFVRSTHQFANFGYQIYNRHWGNGYGQEATRAGLRIGFCQLNLNNRKSIRLVKAIGMRREGIKKRYWFEHGQWVDYLIYVANPEDLGLKVQIPSL